MKKILVFVCLMFISASSYPMTIGHYKNLKGDENPSIEFALQQYITGLYDGMALVVLGNEISRKEYGLPSHFRSFCVPEGLTLNIENLYKIIDDEMRIEGYPDRVDIGLPLLVGLQKTFTCE